MYYVAFLISGGRDNILVLISGLKTSFNSPYLHSSQYVQVCDRMMPGYGEQMRAISLKYVPTAVLSRQTAGLRGKSLIMNLPGKPKSVRETIDEVFVSVPACITLLEGPYIETNDDVVKAFRPKNLIRQA